ncbi:MAG: putative aminotransferase, partial [Rhodococcus erythropolis]|nr:putative aminotransferase [Rhodococcus erythropolis]
AAGQGAMQISPTFVMTDDQVAEMAAGILAALG